MILLVSGATATVRRYADDPHIGHLLTPANGNRIESLLAAGVPVACDNSAFTAFDRTAYIAMLRSVRRLPVLWVTAPDVVGDAHATAARFRLWLPVLRYYGLPVAYVAQDGQERLPLPWDAISCLFIGGTTAWKESNAAAFLVRQAKRRGLWVHIGRVNTMRRLQPFDALGADSLDGGQFSMYPDTYIPRYLARLTHQQTGFLEALCS
jgi:hypothetical protein